ncbi:MAG: DNA translocase FtsK 4TM domain-containing protein, partial [Flavobacteriales bacterium]
MAKKVKKSKPTATKKGRSLKLSKKNKIILGSLLMLFSIALFFSFVSFYFTRQADQSLLSEFSDRNEQAKNLLNKFGAAISHFFVYKGFGLASLIFTFLFFITGLHLFLSLDKKGLLRKWIWGLVFIIWISITLGFFAEKRPLLGGIVGYEMNDFLQDYTGKIGVFLLLLFGLTIILVRLFHFTPEAIFNYFKQKSSSLATDFKRKPSSVTDESNIEEVLPEKEVAPQIIDTYTHKKDIPPLEMDNTDDG